MKTKGLRENVAGLKAFQKKLDKFLISSIGERVEFLRERAEVNAPVLEGDLRSSIKAALPKKVKKVIEAGVTIGDTNYAIKMHEGFYSLGPVSVLQSSTVEGGVGRKYVSRVMDFHHEATQKGFQKQLDGFLEKFLYRSKL